MTSEDNAATYRAAVGQLEQRAVAPVEAEPAGRGGAGCCCRGGPRTPDARREGSAGAGRAAAVTEEREREQNKAKFELDSD